MENLEKIRVYATIENKLNKFVVLKKDDKGYYIEYAFIEGAPHDNRCLDWYHSFQLEAYERNGWFKDLSQEEKDKRIKSIQANRDSKVGKLYRLNNFTCNWENATEEIIKSKEKDWKEFHQNEIFDVDYLKCRERQSYIGWSKKSKCGSNIIGCSRISTTNGRVERQSIY